MTQRTFAVSVDATLCSPWSKETVVMAGDDLVALRTFFSEHFPQHRIVELLPSVSSSVMAPVAFIVETQIKDVVDIDQARATELLDTVMAAANDRFSFLEEASKTDEGFRASYMWDASIKAFAIHVVCPNTYRPASELYRARGIHLPCYPFKTASKGYCLQDKVLGHQWCIPLYLGTSFTVLRCNDTGFQISALCPQLGVKTRGSSVASADESARVARRPVPRLISAGPGGAWARSFGTTPVWLVPVQHTVEFFVRMIRAKTHEYDTICCDVVYSECGTMSEATTWGIIGMKPRPEMQERTVRFLYWIAQRTCPEEYKQWIYEQSSIIAYQFSNHACTDELLQRIFLLNIEGSYISVVTGRDPNASPTLYHFRNIWKVDKGMVHLSQAITRLLTTFIGEELKEHMERNGQIDLYKTMLGEVVRLNYMSTLRNHTIKGVARMVSEDVKFNQNPNILGCNNVVIQLDSQKAYARPGRPEDLVSLTTHLHYRKYAEEECAEVRIMFRKLFGDEELRRWFWRLMCGLLLGSNPERSFYILFGCAKNGKSGLLNLLEIMFGDYFGRFSGKALNERKDPSAASPELAGMEGLRVVGGSELKAGVEMEADILKAITGGDKLPVRGLYQDPTKIRITGKIMIASNHFPTFLHADKALRDRTVLIPLLAFFSNFGVPRTELDQYLTGHFPAIENFLPVIERLAPILLYLLVEDYADYALMGLEPKPKKVSDLINGYWNEFGMQTRYMKDCLEFIDDPIPVQEPTRADILPGPPVDLTPKRPKLTYNSAYERFVAWATSNSMDISKYPRHTFKSLMDCEMASLREHKIEFDVEGWIGCRLKK